MPVISVAKQLYCVLQQTKPVAGANTTTKGSPRWHAIPSSMTLGELLRLDAYVIPGIVSIHVVVKNSPHASILINYDPSDL